MNRDDIIRMAQEAGAFFDGDFSVYDMPEHCFEKFAALVAAAEREACAKVCEDYANSPCVDEMAYRALREADEAIRARGET
jgi:hypothetical protein